MTGSLCNGNRTSRSGSGGSLTYTYYDENQLIGVEAPQNWRSELLYDARGRLRVRREYTWQADGGETEVPKGSLSATDIWSDDNEGLSDYDRSLYGKSKTGGKIAQVCLTSAIPFRPFTAVKQPITHWGGPLTPGLWVMTGGPTARNWLMAGAAWNPGKYTTATALEGSLSWPSGWQWFKGFFGQRIWNP